MHEALDITVEESIVRCQIIWQEPVLLGDVCWTPKVPCVCKKLFHQVQC